MSDTYGHVVCSRLGGPEVLTVTEAELRRAGPGEARIRVQAAGVSWADGMMRRGSYPGQPKPPFTPGYDVVGVVDQCGPGVTELQPGQRVAALTVRGGYAEYVYLPATEPVPIPSELDPHQAVCLVLYYVTAYQMLRRTVSPAAGDCVLVHSTAGGVGTALLELARLEGVRVLGTASQSKHELVSRLGGEPIDYRAVRFEDEVRRLVPQGVRAAFDPIGGWHWLRSRRCVTRGGTVVAYGSQGAGKMADAASFLVLLLWPGRRFSFYSITTAKRRHPDHFREDLLTLCGLLTNGRIQPSIGSRLPWQAAARAHQMLEQGSAQGKIVLTF